MAAFDPKLTLADRPSRLVPAIATMATELEGWRRRAAPPRCSRRLVTEGQRCSDRTRIGMLAADRSAPREYTIPEQHRGIQRLIEIGEPILPVQQVVAEYRRRPAIPPTADREAPAQDRVRWFDRLRVVVGDDPLKLLREEGQVRGRVPRQARLAEVARP